MKPHDGYIAIVGLCSLIGSVIAGQFASPSCPHESFYDGVTTVLIYIFMACTSWTLLEVVRTSLLDKGNHVGR